MVSIAQLIATARGEEKTKIMKAKRVKSTTPAPVPEMSGSDRELLTTAYKSGLIAGWTRDRERGYRLTLANQRDEYVDVAHLPSYIAALRNNTH